MNREIIGTSEAALGYVDQAAALLTQSIAQWDGGTDTFRRTYVIEDDVVIICTVNDTQARAIIVYYPVGGFLYHPKTTPEWAYTLVDNDGGTRKISYAEDSQTWEFDNDPAENYGNIWWISGDDEPSVLSWKGPCTKLLGFDPDKDYTGYTQYYEDILSGQKYTAFGANIYEDGEVIATVPEGMLVLGAAYFDGTLVAVMGANYRDIGNPVGGIGGFYFELHHYNNGVWERKGFLQSSRHIYPFMFSPDGSQAVAREDNYHVTVDTATGGFTASSAVKGVDTVISATGSMVPIDSIKDDCPDCSKTDIGDVNGFDIANRLEISQAGVIAGVFKDFDKNGKLVEADIIISASSISENRYKQQGYVAASYVVPDLVGASKEPVPYITVGTTPNPDGCYPLGAFFICNPKFSGGNGTIKETAGGFSWCPPAPNCVPTTITATGDGGVTASALTPVTAGPAMAISAPSPLATGNSISVSGGSLPISLSVTNGTVTKTGDRTWSFTKSCTPGSLAVCAITATDACGQVISKTVLLSGGSYKQISSQTIKPYESACNGNGWCSGMSCMNGVGFVGGYSGGIWWENYFLAAGATTITDLAYNLCEQLGGGCSNSYRQTCIASAPYGQANVMTVDMSSTVYEYRC